MDKGEFWKSEEYFEVIYLQVELLTLFNSRVNLDRVQN